MKHLFLYLASRNFRFMIAIPTLLLALLCLCRAKRNGWWIPLGLTLSAAGDLAGSLDAFQWQMGLFALALCCYIADFAPHGKLTTQRVRPLVVAFIAFCTAFGFLAVKITSIVEVASMGLYAVVLLSMLSATIIQERTSWGWYVVAALLFVPAGTLCYPEGWRFMAILFVPMVLAGFVMMKKAQLKL